MTGTRGLQVVLATILALGFVMPAPASTAVFVAQHAERAEHRAAESGKTTALTTGTALQSLDRVVVDEQGEVDLVISRHGRVELGADTAMVLERTPFSTFEVNLLTQLRVERGYLRLVWKYPDFGARWPMVVDVGPFRINVTSGEYFVEHHPDRTVLCIAEGQVAISTPGQAEAAVFTASSCYRLMSGAAAQHAEIAPDQFVAVRQQRALMPLAVAVGLAGGQTRVAQVGSAAAQAPPDPAPTATLTPRRPAAPSHQPTATSAPSIDDARDRAIRGALGSAPRDNAPPSERRPSPEPTERARPTTSPAPRAAPASNDGRWALNVASLSQREDALKVQQRLIGKGFTPDIVDATVNGRRWFRVQLRGLADAAEARALAKRLEAEAGFSGAWPVPPAR